MGQSNAGEPSGLGRRNCFEPMAIVFAIGVACIATRVRPEYSPHTVLKRSSRRLDSQDDVNKTLHYEASGWQIKNPASLRDFRLVSSVVYSPFGVINYLWLETSD